MKHFFSITASLCATFYYLTGVSAEILPAETEETSTEAAPAVVSTKDLADDVDRISEEINAKIRESRQTERLLAAAAGDPKYTSKAVEEKRKAVREAEAALLKAQMELRAEVANLPEIKEIAAEKAAREKEVALLREKKKDLLEALRKRSRTSDAP